MPCSAHCLFVPLLHKGIHCVSTFHWTHRTLYTKLAGLSSIASRCRARLLLSCKFVDTCLTCSYIHTGCSTLIFQKPCSHIFLSGVKCRIRTVRKLDSQSSALNLSANLTINLADFLFRPSANCQTCFSALYPGWSIFHLLSSCWWSC